MPDDANRFDSPALLSRYRSIRATTEQLCAPLAVEDYVVQAMPDVSPPKWHLAHTAWFFETFLLRPYLSGYRSIHPLYEVLFNSYYESVGSFFPRAKRGTLSRPTVEEVFLYRHRIDAAMIDLLSDETLPDRAEMQARTELGLQHEQQHQELLLTDILFNFSINPLCPKYADSMSARPSSALPMQWLDYEGGIVDIGYAGSAFAFDNECPRHAVLLQPFRLANRLVTCGEYAEFIAADGYRRPEFWLSDGWAAVQQQGWRAPLYWRANQGRWEVLTLHGPCSLDENEPVCHISHYEADAYARWRGARLPSEAEWEHASTGIAISGNLLETGRLHPQAAEPGHGMRQLYGDLWEWTQSAYAPYPGFQPWAGGLGEYNGKFMCNQFVLRGGSCATPIDHLRPTYRNFFYPQQRWQFSGVRLASDQ